MLRYSSPALIAVLLTLCYCISVVLGCSSRAVPKPRTSSSSSSSSSSQQAASSPLTPLSTAALPTQQPATTSTTTTSTTTPRPNITFPTYKCPDTFDAWYCLNDATCFAVKIGDLPVYSCECAVGFMGQRCEYKEIDGSYMPKRPRLLLEKASIASGAACALLFMLFICLTLYLRYEQKAKTFELYEEVSSYEQDDLVYTSDTCFYCNEQRCCGGAGDIGIDGGGKGGGISYEFEKTLSYRQRLEHAILSFSKALDKTLDKDGN